LHNTVKHAEASKASIVFQCGEQLFASIRDNGKGIKFGESKKENSGNGLKNMQKRIESIGGQFTIYNGQGTVIEILVPLS
jgi:signal transduction histidine kinase